ncbi:hypothetical protein Q8F55_004914 [Vanrija albida]|uniref:Major facilitator superfamily (MFS) profile domain-containing protein n=1 Tax=Vanrija albida TaxID=181172 RepID=A0ABR3Q087_9TREE
MSTAFRERPAPSPAPVEDIELKTAHVPPSAAPSVHSGSGSGRASPAPSATSTANALDERAFRIRQILICLSSFTLVFTTCGAGFSFGVYQELYQSMSVEPGSPFYGASPAQIDLIGTLGVAFMTIVSPFAIAWTKRFSPRTMVYCGGALFFVASIAASYSQTTWQFMLTQGFLTGIGTSFSYIPAVTVAPTWYGARRGLALGIITSGTGLGGVVWAPALEAMNSSLGFRNTLRISGAISTALVLLGGAVIDWDPVNKERVQAETDRLKAKSRSWFHSLWAVPLVDWKIARTRQFVANISANALQGAAYCTPIFFFSAYAKTLGYSSKQGAMFIAVNNVASGVSRIGIGALADRFGHANMLLLCTGVSAIVSVGLWLPSTLTGVTHTSKSLFIAYSMLYGPTASAYVSLFPPVAIEMFGLHNFASVNGFLYMVRGLSILTGTPIAGTLIPHSAAHSMALPKQYLNMTAFVAALLFVATAGVLWVRLEVVNKA